MPILEAKKINRYFKTGAVSFHALKDIELSIEPGRFVILRGRSGSGKTCLLNLLGALDRPTNGQIFYQGEDISAWTDAKRDALRRKDLGFIFQSVALIGSMTAYENVEIALRLAGYPAEQRNQRVMDCLREVGLDGRAKHRPSEMSGGEQQRVAIARALAHEPKLLLADEPTAELDSRMGLRVVSLLKNMASQMGVTVLMTTHDVMLMDLADDVFTIEDGKIISVLHNTPFTDIDSGKRENEQAADSSEKEVTLQEAEKETSAIEPTATEKEDIKQAETVPQQAEAHEKAAESENTEVSVEEKTQTASLNGSDYLSLLRAQERRERS